MTREEEAALDAYHLLGALPLSIPYQQRAPIALERLREVGFCYVASDELAAARLAGKIEGLAEAHTIVISGDTGTDWELPAKAIRAKIAELEATAAATPPPSEEPSA